jgi:Spy/CpxP family protein refolding chaperone
MQQTLKQYCGLMAKNLILAIENAHPTHDIRQYQGKWLTTLFETRISRQQLNELLQAINQSMDNIEALN